MFCKLRRARSDAPYQPALFNAALLDRRPWDSPNVSGDLGFGELFVKVREILETCLYADDLQAAEHFYTTVLGLEVIARLAGRHVFFRCGNRVFLVFNPAKTREDGTELPPHGADGPGHAAFAVKENELPAWRSHLERNGLVIEREINWPNGGRSIYFRDPAGNSIELASPKIWGLDENTLS